MEARDNIPIGEKIAEREILRAPEPIGTGPNLSGIQRLRASVGTSPLEMAAEELVLYRGGLIEAMKLLDCEEYRDLHLRLGNFVNDLDDFKAVLMERCGS